MTSFAQLLAGADVCDDGFAVTIPEAWHQGRTAYGGFSSALAFSAAVQQVADLPPLRSAQVSMIAPLYGEVEVRAREVRRGRNATWVAAEILREGQVGLTASFVFMGPVESSLHIHDSLPPEGVIPAQDAQGFTSEHAPSFLRNNFDVRFALPRSEVKQPEQCWWIRARDRSGLDAMTEVVLCADALPPGVMSLLPPKVPVSTMHWQVNLLTGQPVTQDGWWLLRSRGDYAENGCSSQHMAIWNADGQAISSGTQSIAVFG